MPSIMTLEGPRLGCGPCEASGKPIGTATAPTGGKLALFAIGGVALLGVAYLFTRHDRRRRGLRGPSMLQTIARESKTAEEFARRADAWNAGERDPLPATKLAKAFKRAKPSTVAKLIREAQETRTEGRERLWSRMSKGLKGLVGLDGYRVAYGTSDGQGTLRVFDNRTLDTVEQATKLMRSYKRQGFWTWVEDEKGNFVPVPGAMRESVRKGYPLRDRDRLKGSKSDPLGRLGGLGAAKDLEAAVHAAQLYIGKGLSLRISDEQKLYNRMNKKIASVAKKRGMDEGEAYRQIMAEAKRRGGITPTPGKDI